MSFTVSPVSEPYAPQAVVETVSVNDGAHAQQDGSRRRHPHHHIEPPPASGRPAPSADAESPRTGTLIDVLA